MIICDTGPIVSAINKGEKRRHLFAAELLTRLGRKVKVPWPLLVETDLLLRSRGFPSAAIVSGESMATGVHRLESSSAVDLEFALKLGKRCQPAIRTPRALLSGRLSTMKCDLIMSPAPSVGST